MSFSSKLIILNISFEFHEHAKKKKNIGRINKIRKHCFHNRLLTKNRKAVEINPVQHNWKEYNPNDYKQPDSVYGDKAIFPMHGLLRLQPMDERTKKRLRKHIKEMCDL